MSTSKGHEAGESDGRGVVEHLEVELADVRRLLQDTERSYESRVWELEQQMGHLLAHGQNRNQYTGSEPTTTAASDDEIERRRRANSTMRLDNSNPFPIEGPTTPKPHVHERFKLIFSEDMREIALRICEDCRYGDNEDYWRGYEQGIKDAQAN